MNCDPRATSRTRRPARVRGARIETIARARSGLSAMSRPAHVRGARIETERASRSIHWRQRVAAYDQLHTNQLVPFHRSHQHNERNDVFPGGAALAPLGSVSGEYLE